MDLNFIDLFCGCGGLSNGLIQSGWNCILGIDFNIRAIETFRRNHPNVKTICENILNLKYTDIKEKIGDEKIHLVCGGIPCQGFSTLGKNDPNDSRNFLFYNFVRLVYEIKPELILIENVKGLLSKRNKPVLESIINSFDSMGYQTEYKCLDASFYGVPQSRERVFIIGSLIKKPIFPEPEYGINLKPVRTVRWAFNNLVYDGIIHHNHDKKYTKIPNKLDEQRLNCIPEGEGIRYQYHENLYLPKQLRYDVDWDNLKEKRFRETRLRRLHRDKPSPTLNTSKRTYHHPTENRFLTVREAAAIQSFSPDFIFTGNNTEQWGQVGNAVPPLLAKSIGECLKKLI